MCWEPYDSTWLIRDTAVEGACWPYFPILARSTVSQLFPCHRLCGMVSAALGGTTDATHPQRWILWPSEQPSQWPNAHRTILDMRYLSSHRANLRYRPWVPILPYADQLALPTILPRLHHLVDPIRPEIERCPPQRTSLKRPCPCSTPSDPVATGVLAPADRHEPRSEVRCPSSPNAAA